MTVWKCSADGRLENIQLHNWQMRDNNRLICERGIERVDATCVGCGSIVTGQELVEIFGEETGQGLVVAEMADGVAAGIFIDYKLDSMSH